MRRIRQAVWAFLVSVVLFPVSAGWAQPEPGLPFEVELVEATFDAAPGLHSFAFARHEGLWVFATGRRNPFPPQFANDRIWVIDPVAQAVWSASVDPLPDALADPLRSTNPQYIHQGDYLYIVGGYGPSSAAGQEITFPTLLALHLPGLIEAVQTGTALAPHIRRLTDERMAVTGGDLKRLGDRLYLVFGQRFDGFYRRDGATFTQEYTEQIRSFRIADDGTNLAIVDYEAVTDTTHFHRRDLTVAPVVFPDERLGLAAYGGVFQKDADLPFLNPVYFDAAAYSVDTDFEQRMSHYTCPVLPLFDANTGIQYTTFFGGIGQYYLDDATGELVRDDNVPFIDEVTTLVRHADGTSEEVIHTLRMPALLGSNAHFITDEEVPRYDNGVLKLHAMTGRTRVGMIFGGIQANGPNFSITTASNRLFEVYVHAPTVSHTEPDLPSTVALEAPHPNPFYGTVDLALTLDRPVSVGLEVFDVTGRRVARLHDGLLPAGRHLFTWQADAWPSGVYFVRVQSASLQHTQAVLLTR